MKNFVLIWCLLLVGCGTTSVEEENAPVAKPEPKRNSKCLDQTSMIVDKAHKNGISGRLCPSEYKSYYDSSFEACYEGIKIFMPVEESENDYVDEQRVSLQKEKCFIYDGVHTHKDRHAAEANRIVEEAIKIRTGKTVKLKANEVRIRKLKIINAYVD